MMSGDESSMDFSAMVFKKFDEDADAKLGTFHTCRPMGG